MGVNSEKKRDREIELAYMVLRSDAVKASVDKGVALAYDCLLNKYQGLNAEKANQVRETAEQAVKAEKAAAQASFYNKNSRIGAHESAKKAAADAIKDADGISRWVEAQKLAFDKTEYKPEDKLYHAFLPDQPSMKQLLAKEDRTFEESVALLHSILERAYRFFQSLQLANPLQKKVAVTTGDGGRRMIRNPRSKDQTSKSIAFAKSKGMPTEMGPSYTTVRICSINGLRKDWHGNGVTPSPLSISEIKHLAWAIFAYWTFYYRKGFAGAHCYFAINDAARSCGCALSYGPDYPQWQDLYLQLKSSLKLDSYEAIKSAKVKIRSGSEQGSLERCQNHPLL